MTEREGPRALDSLGPEERLFPEAQWFAGCTGMFAEGWRGRGAQPMIPGRAVPLLLRPSWPQRGGKRMQLLLRKVTWTAEWCSRGKTKTQN